MNKELKEIGKQLKEILDKYPNRQKEILFYIFGEDTIRKLVNKPTYEELEKEVERLKEREKLVTEHYDVMVRHAGNLEGKIIQLEINRDEAIKYIENHKATIMGAYGIPMTKVNELKSILERGKE